MSLRGLCRSRMTGRHIPGTVDYDTIRKIVREERITELDFNHAVRLAVEQFFAEGGFRFVKDD